MKDVMVSIRMPQSMAKELEQQAQNEHFLDLSEFLRSITRQQWLRHQKPELAELQVLRKNIEEELKVKAQERIHREVAQELKKIHEQLKRGGQ